MGDIEHNRETPIARHMRSVHSSDPFSILFWVLEVVKQNVRRGDLHHLLLQKEMAWIFRLKAIPPLGLNDTLSFTSFL